MTVRTTVAPRASAALVLTALLTASCAQEKPDTARPEASSPSTTAHGYVEGAQEAAEQQSRLLLNDPDSGDTGVLDLVTGKVHRTAQVKNAVMLGTDGRFGHLHAPGGTHVLDSGAWMVDHGDHVHYYSAPARDVGELPQGGRARIRSDIAVTAVTGDNGRAVLHDRGTLEKGRIATPRKLPGTYVGAVVPYEEHLLAFEKKGGTTELVVLDREGERVASPDVTCQAPEGDAVTRRGLVLGCADGALLVRARDGALTAEKIPYGRHVPARERATAFRHRPGSDTLTAPAGDTAVWVLDVAGRTWKRVDTGPVVAVNTAGEGSPLLVLETDGAVHGYDIGTGKQTARTEPLLTGGEPDGPDRSAPVIEVDRSRAYVNDPEGSRVFEIDYDDGLRIARSFDLDVKPVLMAETGR
ncbi:hypothetical protein [Streptomyces griseoviridis]|uniref:hypothetical protein n=1 Tax=Streptomyces griseoviridis TaxID=45398 RepID=UPI003444D015